MMKKRKLKLEDIKKVLSEVEPIFKEHYTDMMASFFLLGMDMGKYSHHNNRYEAVQWMKREFGKYDFLIDMLEKHIAKEKICFKCNKQNDIYSNFCSKCGEKLSSIK
jgi:ribosomal protein L40E